MSETYADLGGAAPPQQRACPIGRTHRFDPVSGYCGCGRRDDGRLAPGSPASRAQSTRIGSVTA